MHHPFPALGVRYIIFVFSKKKKKKNHFLKFLLFLGQFWCHFWTPWPQKPLEKSFWVHIFNFFWIYFNYYLSRGRPLENALFSTAKYPFLKNGHKIRDFWEIFWEIFLFTMKLLILSIISKWAKSETLGY